MHNYVCVYMQNRKDVINTFESLALKNVKTKLTC